MESLKRQVIVKDEEYESLEERYKEKYSALEEAEEKLEESLR